MPVLGGEWFFGAKTVKSSVKSRDCKFRHEDVHRLPGVQLSGSDGLHHGDGKQTIRRRGCDMKCGDCAGYWDSEGMGREACTYVSR